MLNTWRYNDNRTKRKTLIGCLNNELYENEINWALTKERVSECINFSKTSKGIRKLTVRIKFN